MRILIFTLLLSLLSFGLKAQDWNMSSDAFNALGSIDTTTTVEGLTIYADSLKKVTVDTSNKSVGDMSFTHRLKLGGAGEVVEGVATSRVVSFDVEGDATITVAAMSSTGDEDRELVILAGSDTLAV
ncbi:MAG: hypothetical protein JW735_07345, partial [Prolixibacteraceae bacterium]|nr:hypothetical protein [Prolixibacteraceae bacterium]